MTALNRYCKIAVIASALSAFAIHAGDYMTAEQITAHLSQITIHGATDSGVKWREKYKPDGKITGKEGVEPYRGKWKVENGMLCLDYAGASEDGCWFVKLGDDNTIQYFLEDGAADGEERFEMTQ